MEPSFLLFVGIGFIAQMIDGALGMAYGVVSNTFLLGMGIPPAAASASIHAAEVFTSGFSGLSHLTFKNVDKTLFKALVIPGSIGGMVGAYILSNFPGERLKPWIAVYLLIMGIVIIRKGLKHIEHQNITTRLKRLALIGGFCDAVGGGGWGPIVASNLLARGHHPRFTIGSVNLAEFFVTFCQSIVFMLTLGLIHWNIIAGLILGGILAAPLAAWSVNRLPTKKLIVLVGIMIVCLSLRTLYKTFLA